MKNIIWYKFLLLLNRVLSEIFGRNFNPQVLKVLKFGLKLFLICTLEMLLGALLKSEYLYITVVVGAPF